MHEEMSSATVRILSGETAESVVGMGILISPRHVMTCVHVVTDALKIDRDTKEMPATELSLDFPLLKGNKVLKAMPRCWFPINDQSRVGDMEDITVLELSNSSRLPSAAKPVCVMEFTEFHNREVLAFGFPRKYEGGDFVSGILQGMDAGGKIVIDHAPGHRTIKPGFSGTAAWDKEAKAVVGMVVSIQKGDENPPSYMIPVSTFKQAFSEEEGLILCPEPPPPDEICEKIADLITNQGTASAVLNRIDFPRRYIPDFKNASEFWDTVCLELKNGIMEDGFTRLFSEIARRYPHNETFSRWRK